MSQDKSPCIPPDAPSYTVLSRLDGSSYFSLPPYSTGNVQRPLRHSNSEWSTSPRVGSKQALSSRKTN